MASPLNHIKVVEISVAMAGPFCGMMLADYGADVVKIERVGAGDDSRAWPPHFHGGMSHYFASANRNKRSVALDLKDQDGVAVARRLIEDADVLIDNYRFGALARAGLDYESLAAANPRLIYCSISGFGASGPRRDDPANDLFMQAFSGGMSITGEIGGGPMKMGLSVADIGAGMMGTVGVMMALEARHATGRGQRVDTSLLEGQVSMLSYHLCRYFSTGKVPEPSGSGSATQVPYQAFKAADDWIVIAAFNQRMWGGFCGAPGSAEWERDPRFADADARARHRDELLDLIGETLARQPAAALDRPAGRRRRALHPRQPHRPGGRRGAGRGARDDRGDRRAGASGASRSPGCRSSCRRRRAGSTGIRRIWASTPTRCCARWATARRRWPPGRPRRRGPARRGDSPQPTDRSRT